MEVNYDFTEDNYWHCGVRHAVFIVLGNVYCVKYLFFFTSSVIYTFIPLPADVV